MKTCGFTSRTILSLLSLAGAHQAFADGPMRDATSPEEMDARMRASQRGKQLPGEPVTGETRVINKVSDSITDTSQLLAANGQWAIVPKGAVIFVPPSQQAHVVTTPTGTLVPWQEFFAANHQWLTNQEVSVAQASGQEPLKEEVVKFWSKQNRVVVATHEGGAISFKPAPTPPKS